MNTKILPLPAAALTALAACLPLAKADILTPVQRFLGMGHQLPDSEEFQAGTIGSDGDYAPFSPADSDLGVQEVLTPYPGRSPLVADFSTAFYRTDNAPSGSPATDDPAWFWIGRASLAWRPRLASGFFGDFGLMEEMLRFDDPGAFDYENTAVTAGVVKIIPELDDLLVFGRYEYQRLTTGSLSDSDYFAHRLRVGARKVIFASPRHELTLGADLAFELGTKQEALERDEYAADLAYRYFFSDCLYSLLTYRISKFDFDTGRDDWAHGVGLELIWEFAENARAHVSLFYDLNDSDTPLGFNDFEAWSSGVGAGITLRF
jgi:hypothetical protein